MTFDGMSMREMIAFKRRHGVMAGGVFRDRGPYQREPDPGDDQDCVTLYMELLDAYASGDIFGGAAVDPLLLALGFKPVGDYGHDG